MELSAEPSASRPLSISVVVVAQGSEPAPCDSASSFEAAGADEVIVVAGRSVGSADIECLAAGKARLIRSDHDSFPRLARLGLEASRGELVAFTEWHCTADAGWADRARHSFEGGVTVVGGSVVAEPGLETRNRALYAVDYGSFASGHAKDAHVLPGVNIVFRRTALAAIEPEPPAEFWKSFTSWELERRGGRLRFDPAPRVTCHRRLSLREITARRWNHGRCFGAMRSSGMSRASRAIYTLAAPVIPFALTTNTLRTIVSYASVAEAIRLLPAVFWIHLTWVAGEWVGHLRGAGGSCDRL